MRRFANLFVVLGVLAAVGAPVGAFVARRWMLSLETDRQLVDARVAAKAGRYNEAILLFGQYVGSRPAEADVRREYATLLLQRIQEGKLTGGRNQLVAFKCLEQVVRETPDDHWLRFQLAKFQMEIKQFPSAFEHLKMLRQTCGNGMAIEPAAAPGVAAGAPISRAEIDALLGESLRNTGQYSDAMEVLSELVGFDPVARQFRADAPSSPATGSKATSTTALFGQLAQLLEQEFEDDQAAGQVYARSVLVNPGDPAAWTALASWKYRHDDDSEAALDAVKKASALAPDDSAVMDVGFQAAFKAGHDDEASAIVKRGLDLHPAQEWPYKAKAMLSRREGDIAATVDALVTGLKKVGARPTLLQSLVELPDEPDWQAALEKRMGEILPELGRTDLFRDVLSGRTLMAKRKWLEASRALESARPLAVALPSLKLPLDLALAKCHEQLGDVDLQLGDFQRALFENNTSIEARIGLARALLAWGAADAALPEFRRVAKSLSVDELAERADVWVPLLRLERAAIARGRPERRSREEVDALTTSLGSSVGAGMAPILRAETLAGDGKLSDAIGVLEAARSGEPDNVPVVVALIDAHARSGDDGGIIGLIDGLPPAVREDTSVIGAEAEACRSLPLHAAERLAKHLVGRRPDDLRAAMTALAVGLVLGRVDDVDAMSAKIAAIAGGESTHARYAAAAASVLGRKLVDSELSGNVPLDLSAVAKPLTEIRVDRPEWTGVIQALAEIEVLEGKVKEAMDRYRQAAVRRPSDADLFRGLAILLKDRQLFIEAAKGLEPFDDVALVRLGRIAVELLERAGKTDRAVEIAARAVASGSENPDDLLSFADLLGRHGRGSEATTALERSIELAPGRIDLWLALADRRASGDPAAAMAVLERAATTAPEVVRPVLRAEIDRRAGRKDVAAAAFQKLLAEPSADLPLMRRAVECFDDAGETSEARATLGRMVITRPVDAAGRDANHWARRRLVEIEVPRGTFPIAMKAVQSLGENAGDVGIYAPEDVDLTAALLAGRPEPKSWGKALELLEGLRQRQPLTVRQAVLAARLRDRLGDWRRSREDLRALAFQPDTPPEVYEALVELHIAHDDPESAAVWIDELASRAPAAPSTIVLQARLALAEGDRPAAVAAARKLTPGGEVTAAGVPAILAAVPVIEGIGFSKAADSLLVRAAAVSDAGTIARFAFLIRQNRYAEATQLLDGSRDVLAKSAEFPLLEATLLEAAGRLVDAEKACRRLADDASASVELRARAISRVALLLLDRNDNDAAFDVADGAIMELGPHPDLLDARGVARVATGSLLLATTDLSEAVLAPTPIRLLHLAHAKALGGETGEASTVLDRAMKAGLDAATLRPADRKRLEYLGEKLGKQSQRADDRAAAAAGR